MQKGKNEDAVQKQLEKAQGLIKAKKFDDARAILLTLDHPTAEKWLNRLNEMNANKPQTIVVQEKKKRGCASTILSIIGAAFLLIVCSAIYSSSKNPSSSSSGGNDLGSRSNPYPAGSTQEVRDGHFKVNDFRADMSAEVHRMNMFNTEPDTGNEWVLVDVTFSCDLSSDSVCTTSFMQFELVGKLGQAYNQQIAVVLDNPFGLEVFGGGQTSGALGFIVDSDDSDFLLVVVDAGRKFFDIP